VMKMCEWLWRSFDLEAELEEQVQLLLEMVQESAYKSVDELMPVVEDIINIIAELKRLESMDR